MTNPSVIGITSILVFILLLILIFALTGHLADNPYGIIIILLIGIILISGFMIISYYKLWWPYRKTNSSSNNNNSDSNKKFNNIVVCISIAVLVITVIIFVIVLYYAIKHHKNNHKYYEIHHHKFVNNENHENQVPNEINEPVEVSKDVNMQPDEHITDKPGEEPMNKDEFDRSQIEHLALENKLQEEDTGLEKGSGINVALKDQMLINDLRQKKIRQVTVEEGMEIAKLKEIESRKALQTMYPSRTMFGPGGSEDIINRTSRSLRNENSDKNNEGTKMTEAMMHHEEKSSLLRGKNTRNRNINRNIRERNDSVNENINRNNDEETTQSDGSNNMLMYMLLNRNKKSKTPAEATEGGSELGTEAAEGGSELGTEAASSGVAGSVGGAGGLLGEIGTFGSEAAEFAI